MPGGREGRELEGGGEAGEKDRVMLAMMAVVVVMVVVVGDYRFRPCMFVFLADNYAILTPRAPRLPRAGR